MTYRLITIDVAHRYPWLNLELGELVTHVKLEFPDLEIRSFHQITPDDGVMDLIAPREGDVIVVHADSTTSELGLKIINNLAHLSPLLPIIRFGHHCALKADVIPQSVINIVGYDIVGVLNAIARCIGISKLVEGSRKSLFAADFSTLPPFSIFNYPIRSSKGCLNRCPFCERWREGAFMRKVPVVLENEIGIAKENYGARALTFWDSMLNNSPEHLKHVCDIAQRAELPWRSNGMTIRDLSKESIIHLARSGCYLASFGIESLSFGVASGKKLTFKEVALVREQLRDSGIMMLGFFIIGLAGDTYSRTMRTIDLAVKLDLDVTLFSPAVALPGTPLQRWVQRNGQFLAMSGSANLQNLDMIQFETDTFSQDERIRALAATSVFSDRNRLTKQFLCNQLGGPESPSSKENISWHQHLPIN